MLYLLFIFVLVYFEILVEAKTPTLTLCIPLPLRNFLYSAVVPILFIHPPFMGNALFPTIKSNSHSNLVYKINKHARRQRPQSGKRNEAV